MFKEDKNDSILSLIITLAIFMIAFIKYDLYYELNDDTTIRNILSGVYSGTQSSLNNQMLYPISIALTFLYKIAAGIEWFDIMLIASHFICLYLLLKTLLSTFNKKTIKCISVVMYVLFVVTFLLENIVLATYTVTSGMLAVTAIFVFIADKKSQMIKKVTVCVLLAVISCCIRSEMLLMMLPFICLAGLYCWSVEDHIFTKENITKYIGTVFTLLVCLGIVFVVDNLAYSEDGWQEYRRFFDARTTVYDYTGIPDFDDNQVFYENNISYEEYLLFTSYNYILDEDINADMMEDMAEYAKGIQDNTISRIKLAVYNYYYKIVHSGVTRYGVLAVIGYLLVLLTISQKSVIRIILTTGTVFGVRSVIWLYLLYNGRVVDRITCPLYWGEFAILIAVFLTEITKSKDITKYKRVFNWILLSCISLIFVIFSFKSIDQLSGRYNYISERAEKMETLQSYCNDNADNFYLMTVLSMGVYPEKVFDGNIEPNNLDLLGGWAVKSPLHKEKLLNYGIECTEDALTKKDNVYIIQKSDYIAEGTSSQFEWLELYYNSKGKNVEVVQVDTIIDNIGVYKVNLLN